MPLLEPRRKRPNAMGCDIHLLVEQRTLEHGWVGRNCYDTVLTESNYRSRDKQRDYYDPPLVSTRNYELFAKLANVRGNERGTAPRGLPPDPSPLLKRAVDAWGSDGHSHTWLPLREAVQLWGSIYFAVQALHNQIDDVNLAYRLFGVDVLNEQDWENFRLVAWFDN